MLWKINIKTTMHVYFKNVYDVWWYAFLVLNLSINSVKIICPWNTNVDFIIHYFKEI